MTEKQEFPYTFEIYCQNHPEKFEKRTQPAKKALYGLGAVACILLVIFPHVVPVLPLWLIRAAAVLGALFCLLDAYVSGENYYNKLSGGKIKRIGLKKFDRVNTDATEIVQAFHRHDFDFLADAAESDNEPLQLYVYEDAAGKEFYLQLRAYVSSSEFRGITDVVTVSGREYDEYKSVIKSIHPVKE